MTTERPRKLGRYAARREPKQGDPMTTMLETMAREMRERYAEHIGDREIVPWEKSKSREAWIVCARAALQAIREPSIDAGLIGAEEVNKQMRGPVKADYCAAQDSFTAIIDAILGEQA